MTNRFGNWAVQRCLETPCTPTERKRVAEVMKERVIELATNCYGTHVVQKALDCAEEIQLSVVSEMLQGDLAATLMNKHASHVWTKIMELTWTEPAPPIFDYVNKAMQGRWADLARHETGSLIVQHAFENLEDSDKSDCVQEVLKSIDTLATDQWGSWVVQHLLENGTENDRAQAVDALVDNIPSLSTDAQGVKAIEKAIKSGGSQAVDQVVRRLSSPAKSGRRPLVVDLALGSAGSQLVSMLLPMLSKAQWIMLHESVRGHIVTLKGSKSGSRVVWLFERMKAQHNN
ncbi:ARM repeat-containing protein [Ceratobasidium sp. AG-I]|nr:ARM repeat-containing protein [Ceratobasidium sp. AG-I]